MNAVASGRTAFTPARMPRPGLNSAIPEFPEPPALRRFVAPDPMHIYTMNSVSKTVPPKRQIIKDISLSFFRAPRSWPARPEQRRQVDRAQDHGRRRPGLRRRGLPAARHQGRLPAAGTAARPGKDRAPDGREGVGETQRPSSRAQRHVRRLRRGPDADFDALAKGRSAWRPSSPPATELENQLEVAADALRLPPWDAVVAKALGRREALASRCAACCCKAGHAAARQTDQPPRRQVGGNGWSGSSPATPAPWSRSPTTATSSTTPPSGSSELDRGRGIPWKNNNIPPGWCRRTNA